MHGVVIEYLHNKVEWFGSHLNGNVRAVNIRGTKCPRIMILCTDGSCSIRALILLLSIWRCLNISTKETQINEEIRDKEVRVIDTDGTQLGVMPIEEAMRLAEEKNTDLVKIAPQAKPPVCKIMDFGKYRFEQAKREKESKKNQKVIEVKEVRLSLNIDTHDFETKANQAIKFLKGGNRVKVSIRFRGREMAHPENGQVIMAKFAEACSECGTVEKQPKLEGRSMLMFLAAKSSKN